MNKFIEKINFKKVAITYVILLLLAIFLISLLLGNIYKEKINTIYNYHKLTESVEESNKTNILKNKVNDLKKSKDIIDIVIINNENANYKDSSSFMNTLKKINNSNRYYTDLKGNIYKLENKEEFILDLLGIKDEDYNYYDNFMINTDKSSRYILNYLENRNINQKIVIISKSNPVKKGYETVKISLLILGLFFMIYWIITVLMVYQNALKLNKNAYFWGVVTLLTNIVGVVFYIIYVRNTISCLKCHTNISIKDKYCKGCGRKI